MLFYVYQRLTMIRRYVVSAISLLRSLELWVENFILPCLLSTDTMAVFTIQLRSSKEDVVGNLTLRWVPRWDTQETPRLT